MNPKEYQQIPVSPIEFKRLPKDTKEIWKIISPFREFQAISILKENEECLDVFIAHIGYHWR